MEFVSRTEIAAPPEAVWRTLTDLGNAPEVVPLLEEVRLLDPELGPGARVVVSVRIMGSSMPTEAVVSRWEPERALGLRAEVTEVRATVDLAWDLAPTEGGTHVEQRLTLEFGSRMARMAASALLGAYLKQETADEGLEQLKKAVEGA